METSAIIKAVIAALGVSTQEFALAADLLPQKVSEFRSGRYKPSYEALRKILTAYPQVSAEFLLTGLGSPLKPAESNKDLATINRSLVARIQELETHIESGIQS